MQATYKPVCTPKLTSVNTVKASAGISMLLKIALHFYAIKNSKLMVFCEKQSK